MARYYEHVRVCPTCFQIYTTLDWARGVLGVADTYGGLGSDKLPLPERSSITPSKSGSVSGSLLSSKVTSIGPAADGTISTSSLPDVGRRAPKDGPSMAQSRSVATLPGSIGGDRDRGGRAGGAGGAAVAALHPKDSRSGERAGGLQKCAYSRSTFSIASVWVP